MEYITHFFGHPYYFLEILGVLGYKLVLLPPFIDGVLHDGLVSVRGDGLVVFFEFFTLFGSWQVIHTVLIGGSVLFFYKKMGHYVMPLWVTLMSVDVVISVLKFVIARPRPLNGLLFEADFSFPSGHAGLTVAMYGFLLFITLQHLHGTMLRNCAVFLCVAIVFLVGFSRLYLGVHYMSDVLAGCLIGFLALLCGIYIHRHYTNADERG